MISSNDFSLTQRISAVLLFILFINLFFFQQLGSFAFCLIATGIFLFVTVIFENRLRSKECLTTISLLAAILAFSIGIVLRANNFVSILLGLAVVSAIILQAYVSSTHIPLVRSLLELVLSPLYFFGSYIKHFFKTLGMILRGEVKSILPVDSSSVRSSRLLSTITGLVVGLLVIGILISMFSNADPIFATIVKNILSGEFLQTLYQRVIMSSIIGILLIPLIIFSRDSHFNSPVRLFKRWNLVHEMSVVMTLVALVMGLFLIVQWPYVFANVPYETDLSKFGVATYSEYVRKGFIELLRISLFIYALIWLGLIILRERKQSERTFLPMIQSIVLIEFFIFLASIFRRVWLYQQYHGWSLVRVYGSFFILWVIGITVFLVLRHFWQKRWVFGEIIFTVLILFIIGIVNVEQFIVNNHPPTVNKRTDYVYLSRMSADGYLGWQQAYEKVNNVMTTYGSKEGLLTKDERREIAYAGIIINELSKNYHDLIKNYGSYEEKKEYLSDLFTFQKQAQKLIRLRNETNKNFQYDANYDANLQKILQLLKDDRFDQDNVFDSIHIAEYNGKYQFINADSSMMTPSFYDYYYYNNTADQMKTEEKDTDPQLEKVFLWNVSKKAAYTQMKNDMSYVDLLELQKKYFDLHRKITLQPTNERDYEMDISLNSPLID